MLLSVGEVIKETFGSRPPRIINSEERISEYHVEEATVKTHSLEKTFDDRTFESGVCIESNFQIRVERRSINSWQREDTLSN